MDVSAGTPDPAPVRVLRVTAPYLGGDEWRHTIDTLLADGATKVAADMSRVEAAGSLAFVNLLWASRKLRRAGGDLAVFSMGPRAAGLVREFQLEAAIPTFASESEAVASFDQIG